MGSQLLYAGTCWPNTTPRSVHEIRFKRPVHLHSFRVLCEGEKVSHRVGVAGQTPAVELSVEFFAGEHGKDELCAPLLAAPHRRIPSAPPSETHPFLPSAKSARCNYLVVRSDDVPLSLCLYGEEAQPRDAQQTAPSWENIPAFHQMTRVLEAALSSEGEPITISREPDDLVQRMESPLLLLQLAGQAERYTTAHIQSPPRGPSQLLEGSEMVGEGVLPKFVRSKLCELSKALQEAERLAALVSLLQCLSDDIRLPFELSDSDWRSLADGVLGILRMPADTVGLSEFDATVAMVMFLARNESAAAQLIAGGSIELLQARLSDRFVAAPLRARILLAIRALVLIPIGMARWVAVRSDTNQLGEKEVEARDTSQITKASGDGESATKKAAQREESGVAKLVSMLRTPLPLPLLQPILSLVSLAALWDATTAMRRAVAVAVEAEAPASVVACDHAASSVLLVLRKLTFLLHCYCSPSYLRWGAIPVARKVHSPEGPILAGLSPFRPVGLAEMELLANAGLWDGIAGSILAPCVRGSTMQASIAYCVTVILDLLLMTEVGSLSLANNTDAAAVLASLKPVTSTASGVSEPISLACNSTSALPDLPAGQFSLDLKSWMLSSGAIGSTGDLDDTWAAQTSRKVGDLCLALGALNRLLAGKLDAMHTLHDAGGRAGGPSAEAAARVLQSRQGVGALVAVLVDGITRAGPDAATRCKYAADLLERALVAPYGAFVSWEHGALLRRLFRGSLARSPPFHDGPLAAALLRLEALVQPALLLRERGVLVLSQCVASTLQGRVPDALIRVNARYDAPRLEFLSRSERVRHTRAALRSSFSLLRTALALVRHAAVTQSTALVLFESDGLRWLQNVLEGGASILESSRADETALLPLLEDAAIAVYSILWYVASGASHGYRAPGLLSALVRVTNAITWQPTYALAALGADALSPVQVDGLARGRNEPLRPMLRALSRCFSLFVEGLCQPRLDTLLEELMALPSSAVAGAFLLPQVMPTPLPLAIEQLPEAASGVVHPNTLAMPSPGWSYAAMGGADLERFEPKKLNPYSASSDVDVIHERLCTAAQARRSVWSDQLVASAAKIERLVAMLAHSATHMVIVGVAGLCIRLVDLMPPQAVQDSVICPLVEIQQQLSKQLESDSGPGDERGNAAAGLARINLLLATISTHPAGRAALLALDPSKLISGLLRPLKAAATVPATAATTLTLLEALCDSRVDLSPADLISTREPEMPDPQILGPSVTMINSLADSGDHTPSALRALACRVRVALMRSLARSSKPSIQSHFDMLRKAQGIPDDELISTEGVVTPPRNVPSVDSEKHEATRAFLWPCGWRSVVRYSCIDMLLSGIAVDTPLFVTGLVSAKLQYGWEALREEEAKVDHTSAPKRQRVATDMTHEVMPVPPSVRSCRGRTRDEGAGIRNKPNTSRPPSKHVDDVQDLGPHAPKRLLNSARAPPRNVDLPQVTSVVPKMDSHGGCRLDDRGRKAGDLGVPDKAQRIHATQASVSSLKHEALCAADRGATGPIAGGGKVAETCASSPAATGGGCGPSMGPGGCMSRGGRGGYSRPSCDRGGTTAGPACGACANNCGSCGCGGGSRAMCGAGCGHGFGINCSGCGCGGNCGAGCGGPCTGGCACGPCAIPGDCGGCCGNCCPSVGFTGQEMMGQMHPHLMSGMNPHQQQIFLQQQHMMQLMQQQEMANMHLGCGSMGSQGGQHMGMCPQMPGCMQNGMQAQGGQMPGSQQQILPGLSKEKLQELMQDESKLQQFLADNPSMMEQLLKIL